MATFDDGEWNDLIPCEKCKALVFNRDMDEHLRWHARQHSDLMSRTDPRLFGSGMSY